jgi:hypothetical protein
MGVDGFNSLLLDIQAQHFYEPANTLRLVTGLLTGISLAVAISFLLAATLWRRPDLQSAPVDGVRDIIWTVVAQAPLLFLANSGNAVLYAPVSLFLVLSAATVVSSLMLVLMTLVRRRDGTFDSIRQLQMPATFSLLLGFVIMAAFAGGRFLLEWSTGAPPLT